jgi:ubiquinone/menaquinone biosynthesis C-methylase UbiE
LLNHNPQIEIDAVDASDAMLRQLVHRAGRNAVRVRTQLADARRLNFPAGKFDLVAAHFFLDCLTTDEVKDLALKIRTGMQPGSAWVVSEFAIPSSPFGKLIATPLVSSLYFAFRLLTGLAIRRLPDHGNSLREAGFRLSKRRKWLGGLLVSEMWEPVRVAVRLSI